MIPNKGWSTGFRCRCDGIAAGEVGRVLIARHLENHYAGPTSSKRLQGATKLSEVGTLTEQNTELEGEGGAEKG